jgi:Rab GDP dissociation inhibitor
MKEVYDKFGLEATTRDFIGHAMALYLTDDYMNEKGRAPETIERISLYGNSVSRYGKSPYIYPLFGLGELPQAFSRLSAIYGGTYMLKTVIDPITYDKEGFIEIVGGMYEMGKEGAARKDEPLTPVKTRVKKVIAAPSYFKDKCQIVGKVIRAICILNHPIANTDNADSCQLIIPQSQVGRKNGMWIWRIFLKLADKNIDIYIAMVSSAHSVCPKGYYVAYVSTIAETEANHHLELAPGFERLGRIEEKFMVSYMIHNFEQSL